MYYGKTVKHGPTVKELTEFHNFCKKTCALVYTTPPFFYRNLITAEYTNRQRT